MEEVFYPHVKVLFFFALLSSNIIAREKSEKWEGEKRDVFILASFKWHRGLEMKKQPFCFILVLSFALFLLIYLTYLLVPF